MSQIDVLKIIAKNVGTAVADTLSFNMGSAIKNSAEEIKEYSKLTNDALYYLQIQKFLETADLDSEEVEAFLKESLDNQRLGLELFKVLEKTHLEKQAELMGIAFKKYVKGNLRKNDYYLYVHIIEKLDRHTFTKLETDVRYLDELLKLTGRNTEKQIRRTPIGFKHLQHGKSDALIAIGFMEEEVRNQEITERDIKIATERRQAIKIKQETYYKRTDIYERFCRDIFLETICT